MCLTVAETCQSLAADGGGRLLGDYETEQLCAKLTLGELQGLCASLAADGVDREQMIALLQARRQAPVCDPPLAHALATASAPFRYDGKGSC